MSGFNTTKSIVKSKGNKPSAPIEKQIDKNSKYVYKISIGYLEKMLLKKFPAKTACDWDKTGLLVGDKNEKVAKIAVALDPSVQAVEIAAKNACNLLLTHHPAFRGNFETFYPEKSVALSDGALVYAAIKNNVALMNFHTALDVSREGSSVLPSLLNLKQKSVLCPIDNLPQKKSKLGFGKICVFKDNDKEMTLLQLSARCKSVFGKAPRVWGDFSTKLKKVVTTTGSCGSLDDKNGVLANCLEYKISCLICGEIKYHDALSISQAGVCVIELGHDTSEIPLVGPLASSLVEIGINKNDIVLLDQSNNWNYSSSTSM